MSRFGILEMAFGHCLSQREGSSLGAEMPYLGAALAFLAVPLVPDADTAQFFTGVPAAVQGRQPGSTVAARHPCYGQRRIPKVPSCSAVSPRRVQN